MTTLTDPLALPCGAVVPNRLLKSAMSEVLGTRSHAPSEALPRLYGRWAQGGVGLPTTGSSSRRSGLGLQNAEITF